MIQKIKNFFSEVRTEMQKVTWPTREELVGSTGVVLMLMFILSTFIGAADFVLSILVRGLLR
ncbi:MAG: preprotein translocase subunit SecE [Omnitrophica bacterium RIFCSPHIGHO2_02_FULL_51_18]|nr:MAG: preprotein translocase subunit SecE [Omnitrophica bacterium RIFCSPHIGHO2_02_FULL_51_18]